MPLQKVPKNRPGVQARMNFKRQDRAFVHSACTPGPPLLRGPRIRSASHPVRRMKSGRSLLFFPLPLHCPMFRCRCPAGDAPRACIPGTGAPAAHGRAPGGEICGEHNEKRLAHSASLFSYFFKRSSIASSNRRDLLSRVFFASSLNCAINELSSEDVKRVRFTNFASAIQKPPMQDCT